MGAKARTVLEWDGFSVLLDDRTARTMSRTPGLKLRTVNSSCRTTFSVLDAESLALAGLCLAVQAFSSNRLDLHTSTEGWMLPAIEAKLMAPL